MEVNGEGSRPEEKAADTPEAGQPRVVDRRRFRAVDDEVPAAPEEGAEEDISRLPTFVEELRRKLAVAEEKLHEHIERVNRESAEFRIRQERELKRRTAEMRKQFVGGFLGLADDLSRALAAADSALGDLLPKNKAVAENEAVENLIQGIRMIQGQFFQELASHGVQPFSAVGERFDPLRHEAIRTLPVSDPAQDGQVIEEVAPGYLMGEEVLRPSRVCVGKFAPAPEGGPPKGGPPEGKNSPPQTASDA